MKRLPFYFALFLFFAMQACESPESASTNHTASSADTSAANPSDNEAAVADAVDRLSRAMESADSSALYALTSSKLTYGHSSGKVEDQQTYIANILNGSSDFVKIDIEDQNIIMDGETAVVRHHLTATTNDRGQEGHVDLKVMLVWQLQDSDWKLIARQAVK